MVFIERLEEWNIKDNKLRAELRKSLTFEPGKYPRAFPYVEPFINGEENAWKREMYYLVAGLWAAHWKSGKDQSKLSIGVACAEYMRSTGSANTEKRFIALIDSDPSQLPHRLRQMIFLLKDYKIDMGALLKDLLYWNDIRKFIQYKWAREFYRSSNADIKTKNIKNNGEDK